MGFTDSLSDVVNTYFEHHIPLALNASAAIRDSEGMPLRYMLQSFIVHLYLHCPPHAALRCPSADARARLRRALRAGDVTYHAFPHNAELEAGSPAVIAAGLQLTRDLDVEVGLANKTVLSQRDVPGISRAVIPLLVKAGVTAVSVGVNTASMYPRVPRAFRWLDPISGESVLAMSHPHGYASYHDQPVEVPGWDHVLYTDWNDDNKGPHRALEYRMIFKQLRSKYPNASITSSTFDNFTSQLIAGGHLASLPVVSSEIGDSWVYGDPSDAKKLARMRALHRAWEAYAAKRLPRDAVVRNASAFMLKNIEHTWGNAESGLDYGASDWTNGGFAKARASRPRGYEALEASWHEQRYYGIELVREALRQPPSASSASASSSPHPLGTLVESEIAAYEAATDAPWVRADDPAALGWVASSDPAGVRLKAASGGSALELGFDATTGALTTLVRDGVAWASPTRPLFGLSYRTYSAAQYDVFMHAYSAMKLLPPYFLHDFSKHGDDTSVSLASEGRLVTLWTRPDDALQVLLELALDDDRANEEYGGARRYFLHVVVDGGRLAARATLNVAGKVPTRHAEAMFVTFNPPQSAAEGAIAVGKLGQWLDATANLTVDGGSKRLHGSDAGLRFTASATSRASPPADGGGADSAPPTALVIGSLDAGVVCLGEPSGFPVHLNASDPWKPPEVTTHGASSMLFNNLWGTNYVMWQPYRKAGRAVDGADDFAFRYTLEFA